MSTDDTVYIKKGRRYQPVGRLFDWDQLHYGDWFVHADKGYTSIKRVQPKFDELGAAIIRCSDLLAELIVNKLNDQERPHSIHEAVTEAVQDLAEFFILREKLMENPRNPEL